MTFVSKINSKTFFLDRFFFKNLLGKIIVIVILFEDLFKYFIWILYVVYRLMYGNDVIILSFLDG